MSHSGLIIHTNLDQEPTVTMIDTYVDIQAVVDGLFEVVVIELGPKPKSVKLDMWVNEEARIWDMPHNQYASVLAGKQILGDALITGEPTSQGDGTSLPLEIESALIAAWHVMYHGKSIEWFADQL